MDNITLYNHQKEAIKKFRNRNIILAHEMGLGKTLTAINIAKGRKCLIVCPARLKQSWVTELGKAGEESIQVVETAKDEFSGQDWTILSYDMLSTIWRDIVAQDFEHFIVDESHYIKGKFRYTAKTDRMTGTQRAGATVLIGGDMDQVTLLTGTPVMNKPIELWNQLMAIGGQITKDMSRSEFSRRYCGGHLKQMGPYRFWWEGGSNHLEELRDKIKDDIDIIKKSEVLDLPPKIVNTKTIEFSTAEQKKYDIAWEEYLAFVEANPEYDTEQVENIVKAQQLVEIVKLRQITSKAKAEAVIDDLENLQGQLVIFAEFVKTVDKLNNALKQKKITYSTIKDGDDAVAKFQSGKVRVFTANIVAGGTGLNLQNANQVLIVDENWTPAINTQAEDRVYRIGQDKTAFITYYRVHGTVDETVAKANVRKKKVIAKITN